MPSDDRPLNVETVAYSSTSMRDHVQVHLMTGHLSVMTIIEVAAIQDMVSHGWHCLPFSTSLERAPVFYDRFLADRVGAQNRLN